MKEDKLWLSHDQVDDKIGLGLKKNTCPELQKMIVRMKKYVLLKPLKLAKYWLASAKWWIGRKDSAIVFISIFYKQQT
jgi:hypothetical protein